MVVSEFNCSQLQANLMKYTLSKIRTLASNSLLSAFVNVFALFFCLSLSFFSHTQCDSLLCDWTFLAFSMEKIALKYAYGTECVPHACVFQCIHAPKAMATNTKIIKLRRKRKKKSWLEDTIKKSTIVLLQKKFIWVFCHFNAILSYWWAFANESDIWMQQTTKTCWSLTCVKHEWCFQNFWQNHSVAAKQWQQMEWVKTREEEWKRRKE